MIRMIMREKVVRTFGVLEAEAIHLYQESVQKHINSPSTFKRVLIYAKLSADSQKVQASRTLLEIVFEMLREELLKTPTGQEHVEHNKLVLDYFC